VTDNAQSVFELSTIESIPNIKQTLKKDYGFDVNFERAKHLLEENDGAGNTFKATAKPVLIGTAVVGATTMIFSIIVVLTERLKPEYLQYLSILHPPFLLGLITGGCMIYWFTGASTQAVTTGAYRAVEFIKANIRLDREGPASVEDSKKVVEICTQYAQKGMFNIFLAVFFGTLGFAFLEPYFFIGYLVSIALFGLFQAIFMANAGGAWDNAKKIVEVELKEKGTPLHAATVQGHLIGGSQPGHQVHDAVRAAGGRAGCPAGQPIRLAAEPHPVGGVPVRVGGVRLALVLRHADRDRPRLGRSGQLEITGV
jgi:K(+)-stimulated pyrophosphate-energized sodium pump